MNGGIIGKAESGTDSYLEAEIKEKVNLAYNEWKMDKESGVETILKDVVENRLNESYGADNVNVSKVGKGILVKVSKSGKDYEYTLIPDGTVADGKIAYLDIAEGSIDLKENGYVQGTISNIGENYGNLYSTINGEMNQDINRYIITGTTSENIIKISEKGNYNVTIKDLKIDVSGKTSGYCAFIASGNPKGTNVTINIEGENYLKSITGAGISFIGNTPNIDGETSGSILTIQGKGSLEAVGGSWAAGIGGHYVGGTVCNIIINSGNIVAIGNGNACGIGGGLRQNAGNIIINGGNIIAKAGNRCGIGADGQLSYIEINGGNITANGGEYGTGIGGSGKIKITGGNIIATRVYDRNAIGGDELIITGGTIKSVGTRGQGIYCKDRLKITGGNILARGKNNLNIATFEEGTSNLIAYTPNDGTNNLYETKIKLEGLEKDKQVTRLTTSDNINYGIKDMYTLEDGMLYLYLPAGTRIINVEVDGNTYSGIVETKETAEVVTLNKVN